MTTRPVKGDSIEIPIETAKTIGAISLFPVLIGTIVFGSIIRGWVLVKLWAWFVLPVFNLPKIHTMQAIGLMLFVSFVINHPSCPSIKKQSMMDIVARALGMSFIYPMLVLGIAAIWHHFM